MSIYTYIDNIFEMENNVKLHTLVDNHWVIKQLFLANMWILQKIGYSWVIFIGAKFYSFSTQPRGSDRPFSSLCYQNYKISLLPCLLWKLPTLNENYLWFNEKNRAMCGLLSDCA